MITASNQNRVEIQSSAKTQWTFFLIASLFFLWGFSNSLNPILIPHLKKSFTLSMTQATLVDSAVYIAYFLMAVPAGLVIKKFGYKIGIVSGLLLFSVGAALFLPAANLQTYNFFLFALFVIACGLAFLETAANPYAAALGPHDTSAQRLNLAQSFNGLAVAIAPIIGARVILTKGFSDDVLRAAAPDIKKTMLAAEAASVKTPYLILSLVLFFVALVFVFMKLPSVQNPETNENKSSHLFQAFRHKNLSFAICAQFFYVGAQVCVFSLYVLYASKAAGIDEIQAADYLGICGIAFLIGRFTGTFLMRFMQPSALLLFYGIVSAVLSIIAIGLHGMIVIYATIGICFFMSIMFPTIFALGIKNLGRDTEYGSSLLIMSIVGGAILPRVFGIITDKTGNIQIGYFVPFFCFLVVACFGWQQLRAHRKAKVVVTTE